MNFRDRMLAGADFEVRLIERLQKMGWPAFPFGQGLLPEECRERLKRYTDKSGFPCLIRWMPDIITYRDMDDGTALVALIDAKTCPDRPNYSIEIKAIETMEIYKDKFHTPTFFVFDDWNVLTPRTVRERGWIGPPPRFGSGTPYMLVSKEFSLPMSEVFTSDARAAA